MSLCFTPNNGCISAYIKVVFTCIDHVLFPAGCYSCDGKKGECPEQITDSNSNITNVWACESWGSPDSCWVCKKQST